MPAVREVVAETIRRELEAREQHATNGAPAYQSRVAQGSVASFLGAAALFAELWTNGVPDAPTLYIAPVTIIFGVGALWTVHRKEAVGGISMQDFFDLLGIKASCLLRMADM